MRILRFGMRELGGTTVAGYKLENCLGHGTCTAVYRASGGSAEHAVKVIDDRLEGGTELAARLRHESGVLNRLGQKGILPIEEVGRGDGMTVMAMPLKQATTLHDLILRGQVSAEEAWGFLDQIAESLEAVHQQGLTYRLLKPVNVLIADGHPYLAEFGATGERIGAMALSTPGFSVVEPQYLAPEQIEGRPVDPRTDVYAFGVLAFELATRTPLHESAPVADVLRAILSQPPPAASACNPRLPADVDPVLQRALSRDPARRQQSVRQLLEELVYPPETSGKIVGEGTRPAHEPAQIIQLKVAPKLDLAWVDGDRHSILDSFLATCVRLGRQVAGPRWPAVLTQAGLEEYLIDDPPERGELVPEMLALTRLAGAFEAVFGKYAPDHLHSWGELVGESWVYSIQERPHWMGGPSTGRLVDMLSVIIEALNEVRGDELFSWRQLNRNMFRVVHERNIMAVGRRRATEGCQFWRGLYEATLRWAGLSSDWMVDEVECGCVSGTYDCVFTMVRSSPVS